MNPFLYYIKNKKTAFLFVLILTLSIFTVITVITLESSVHHVSRQTMLSPLSEFSIVRWQVSGEEPDVDALSMIGNGFEIFEVSLWHVGLDTLLGSMLSIAIMPDNLNDLTDIFTESGLQMIEGHFPREGYNEIIVHESVMINQELSIGEIFFSGLTVSGYFSGMAKTAFGLPDLGNLAHDFLLFPNQGNLHLLNLEIDELNHEEWEIFSYRESLATFEEDFSKMISILFINLSLISLSIAIALGSLAYTMYQGRLNEFAMLNALGYKKKEIGMLIFLETVTITGFSWFLGYLLSLVALFVLDLSFFRGLGQSVLFFSLEAILLSIVIIIFIIFCAVIPALRKLFKSDLVSILERG